MKIFKKMLSVFLAAVVMLSVLCAGTVSAGAAGEKVSLTVDGFYNQDNEYCIRVDGLTELQMSSLAYYSETTDYGAMIELGLTSGGNEYYFLVIKDTIGTTDYNIVSFMENGKTVDIEADGRFYANENADGTYTYGYVIFIPENSPYIKKLTSCKTGYVGAGFCDVVKRIRVGITETYELKPVTPKFNTVKAVKSNDISDLSISKITNKKYTGKNRTPSVTIKDGSYKLKKGTDYTITYKNNKNIGTATAVIKGKGNYTGTKEVTFKIVPQKTTLKSKKSSSGKLTLTWDKALGAGKYQIYYSENGGEYKKLTSVSGTKTSFTTSKLDFKKNDYKFKIRTGKTVDGKTYYSSFSEAITVK